MTKIYDAHAHLAVAPGVSAKHAGEQLSRELDDSGVEQIVLLPIVEMGYGNSEIEAVANREKRVIPFATVNPLSADAIAELHALAATGPFRGLRLHPRMQKCSIRDDRVVSIVQAAGDVGWPVVIDCHPDRDLFALGSLPLDYDNLCLQCPTTKIVMAHFGGYRALEAHSMAKFHQNLYLDLSLTLLYLRGTSVIQDMAWAIRNLRGQRVLFGTDYPDRGGLKASVEASVMELDKMNLQSEWRDLVLWKNLESLLSATT